MRPKTLNGEWYEPFYHLEFAVGFVEATAAQATWYVPHDLKGLSNLMGGDENMSLKLNRSFLIAEQHGLVTHNYRPDRFVSRERRKAYINYGNQPSMQTAFVFNYVGKPWLTQKWSRKVLEMVYSDNDPQHGYSGDEDQGLMGALAVLMKIGLFEMKGGAALKPEYEIGSPIFDKITIHLNEKYYPGEKFVIEASNNTSSNIYIQSAQLNDQDWQKPWFYHDDLVKGGTLRLKMGKQPNEKWGSNPADAPQSMSDEKE